MGRGRRTKRGGNDRDDRPDVAPPRPPHARDGYVDGPAPKAWYKSFRGINGKIRSETLISRALHKIGLKKAAGFARKIGYGRVRRGGASASTRGMIKV